MNQGFVVSNRFDFEGIYNGSRIGGLIRAGSEDEYFARPIVFK